MFAQVDTLVISHSYITVADDQSVNLRKYGCQEDTPWITDKDNDKYNDNDKIVRIHHFHYNINTKSYHNHICEFSFYLFFSQSSFHILHKILCRT